MIIKKLQSTLQATWDVSKKTSTAYLVAQTFTLAILMFYMLSNTVMIDLSDVKGGTLVFTLRGIVEALAFILLTHFFLRSYLKINVVNQGLSIRNSLMIFFIVLLVSILSAAISKQIGDIPFFDKSQPEDFTFLVDGKEITLTMSDPKLWVFIVINQLFFFGGWTLIYIVWHAVASKREMQKQMQEARIQQLTNQLSPHFLFNTLNSIRALIYEDKDKAADLVTQLSEIFRTHLQAHLQSTATLEEEWQVAERYLTIEQARLEERLKLTCEIDEALWQQKLPTLCLLTLIENAIKHGVSPNPETGFIEINATLLDTQRWRLTITNSVCEHHASDGTKTGLKNTRDRLELMFGQNVTFTTQKTTEKFSVCMELPYD